MKKLIFVMFITTLFTSSLFAYSSTLEICWDKILTCDYRDQKDALIIYKSDELQEYRMAIRESRLKSTITSLARTRFECHQLIVGYYDHYDLIITDLFQRSYRNGEAFGKNICGTKGEGIYLTSPDGHTGIRQLKIVMGFDEVYDLTCDN